MILKQSGLGIGIARKISPTLAASLGVLNSAYYMFKLYGVYYGSLETFDELYYGKYLRGPESMYDASEFEQFENTSYLVCNYYNTQGGMAYGKSAYTTFAKDNDDFVPVKGRWMLLEKKSNAFASTGSPIPLETLCVKTLLEKKRRART